METGVEFIPGGTVTTASGFRAGAVCAGIDKDAPDKLDIGVLFSEVLCTAAGVFTTNRIKAAPVVLTRKRLRQGRAAALVANSGCANAFTGERGLRDAAKVARLAAVGLGLPPEAVLVASTGVIGTPLPMRKITPALAGIALSRDGGSELAQAIMTTDTFAKEVAVRVKSGRGEFVIGGVAKGAGMIHPDMATMLCFITTDASLETDFARAALKRAVDDSFNMVSVDGDTSTNDMVLLLANGLSSTDTIALGSTAADLFEQGLGEVCVHLARCIASDGEGASRLVEVMVEGAVSQAAARLVARTVASSSLVKAAVHGADPNWGRIVAAIGRSGARVSPACLDISIGDVEVVRMGSPVKSGRRQLTRLLAGKEVSLGVNLNLGPGQATAWGCDLSAEYVSINSDYTT